MTSEAELLAHELYTAAQCAPGEGIEDAALRMAAILDAGPYAEIRRLTQALTPARWTQAHHEAWDGAPNWPMRFTRLLELKG